MGNNKTWAM